MKIWLFFIPLILLIISCDKKEDGEQLTPCLEEKFEEFKANPGALAIIKFDKPGDPWYWFKNMVVDDGDVVMNQQCFTCVVDLDFITEHLCDSEILSYPQEIIWEK